MHSKEENIELYYIILSEISKMGELFLEGSLLIDIEEQYIEEQYIEKYRIINLCKKYRAPIYIKRNIE